MSRGNPFAGAIALSAVVGLSASSLGPADRAGAAAAEITVLSADVFTGVLDELVGGFERQTGHHVTIVFGSAGATRTRVLAGEHGDVAIMPRPMMDDALRLGRVVRGSIVDMARSAVGVAVRTGAPKPDISSVDAFARALSAAESITYPNPARGGATGVLVTRVLERLGLTERVQSKTRFPPAGHFAVDLVARGEAAIAISQPMEILRQRGVELVGLLPAALQDPPNFVFSAGMLVAATEQRTARALIQFLSSPAAAAVFKANGMNPG